MLFFQIAIPYVICGLLLVIVATRRKPTVETTPLAVTGTLLIFVIVWPLFLIGAFVLAVQQIRKEKRNGRF